MTLLSRQFCDQSLLALAVRLHHASGLKLGATDTSQILSENRPNSEKGIVEIAVCGAHLSGLPLNYQLTERGAWLIEATTSSKHYRLFALPGGPPHRPGMVRDSHGARIEVEVWAMPEAQVGNFLQQIPPPLGLGKLELNDGRWVTGFICEPCGIEGASEVTDRGAGENIWQRVQIKIICWHSYLSAIETAIGNSFGEMMLKNLFRIIEVSDSPGNFEDSMTGARRHI